MFLTDKNKTVRAIAGGVDFAVDFATLGEYRVLVDAAAPAARDDLWARDLEWAAPERSRDFTCTLPRARDRALARQLVRG